ncbi:HNH endonuclease [Fluviicola sp. SGL-29]|nr:HNH endonuclease [Fluviicola sp. SGL-29]
MNINQTDITNIETAISQKATIKIWDNPLLKDFKKKVKKYFRSINDECCYCKKNFTGEFNMVIDIEHILPKSKFENLMFTIFNLNIACKRCNMNVKNENIDFLVDLSLVKTSPEDPSLYKFIHPNFDIYDEHIDYLVNINSQKKVIKFLIVGDSAKGKFTYDYFKLNELEIDTINQAQGVKKKEELSDKIPPDMAKKLENIFKQL